MDNGKSLNVEKIFRNFIDADCCFSGDDLALTVLTRLSYKLQ